MRNLKKFLALVLAMMMTLSLMVTVNAASSDFKDKDDITPAYAEAIDVLSELGVIKGQGEGDPNEGKFMPKDPITRGEVAAIMYRIVTGDVGGASLGLYEHKSVFTDVNADDWFAPYVNFCENNRLIEGVGNNKFAPRDNINGYEALTMILRAIGYDNRNEYRQVEWRTWASGWGNKLGLTDNIAAGSLGAPATREMVAEIMFQGIQAPMVNYSILNQYTPELLVDASKVNTTPGDTYAADIPNTLLYQTFKIVGKSETLTFDDFGRPNVMWIRDMDSDTVEDGTKYIENSKAVGYDPDADSTEGADEAKVSLTMSTVAKYDNAVTECQVAKDINSDKKVAWKNIAEVLNGNAEAAFEGTTGTKIGTGNTLTYAAGALHKDTDPDMDALHTSDKWIGATGRTTEIYDISDYDVTDKLAGGGNAQTYVIVYVDTYLAEVKSITEAVKDPNDHVIKAATATVKMGTDEIEVSLSSAKSYKVGDLVLVQTANGAMTGINLLAAGEKVPETPTDVDVVAAAAFPAAGTKCALVAKADTKRVTIKATVGTRDAKMGIIPEDGNAIYASNTFLANKTAGAAKSVLPEWWDVDDAAKGITNSMIGRTFDLVLDQNGYIVGMKEVITTESNVGIITGYDQHRVGSGKYLTAVEAYMSDGTTQTFNVVDMTSAEAAKIGKDQSVAANKFDTSKFTSFKSGAAADDAWDYTSGVYAKDAKLGIGSLVMFKQCTVDGVSAWYFEDASNPAATATLKDKEGNAVTDNLMVGTALKAGAAFKTGDALAIETALELDNAGTPPVTLIDHQLDNKSIIFVAEPEYAYNTGKENEGDNTLKYNVYEGFKKMPTITQASTAQNILFQQLVNHPEYVLVYPQQSNLEYIIRNQETITVDDSYLVLSRGATYAGYSEYNVLKNGKADVLQVSNSNTSLNEAIEAAMKAGKLLTVTGRNSAGYVIAADTVENLANATPANSVAVANCGGVMSAATHPNPLVTGAGTVKFSENDGVLNFIDGATTDQGLTLADNCTIQLVNLGTGAVKDITIGVAKVYINKEGNTQAECDFTFELDQYGYVCSLYVIEK